MFVDVICFGNPGLGVTSFLGLPLFGHDFFSPLVVASESLAMGSWPLTSTRERLLLLPATSAQLLQAVADVSDGHISEAGKDTGRDGQLWMMVYAHICTLDIVYTT